MVTMSVLSANTLQKRLFATTSRTRDATTNTHNSTYNSRVCSTDWIRYLAACGGVVHLRTVKGTFLITRTSHLMLSRLRQILRKGPRTLPSLDACALGAA